MKLIRTWELWPAIKAKLNQNAHLLQLLQGGKVYMQGDLYTALPSKAPLPYCDLVVTPALNMWPDAMGPHQIRRFVCIIRVECHPNNEASFNPAQLLDGIHAEVVNQLDGYIIPRQQFVMGATAMWMSRPPQASPLWDEGRGLFFTSAEWRCELATP